MSCFKSCRTFKKTIVITPSVTRMAQPVTQTTVPETITTPEIQADSEKKMKIEEKPLTIMLNKNDVLVLYHYHQISMKMQTTHYQNIQKQKSKFKT